MAHTRYQELIMLSRRELVKKVIALESASKGQKTLMVKRNEVITVLKLALEKLGVSIETI